MRFDYTAPHQQQPLGDVPNHYEQLARVVENVDMDVEFPAYVYEDPFFSDPDYPVAMRCFNTETREPLHVVLISSIDGVAWYCWMVEYKRFEIMELQAEDEGTWDGDDESS